QGDKRPATRRTTTTRQRAQPVTITFYLPPVLLPRCTPRWRARLASLFIVAVAALPVAAKDAGRTNELVAVHFAFSKAMFKDINENDAMAAMKVYSKNIGDEGGVDTSFGPIYLDGTNAIAEALRRWHWFRPDR